MSRIDFDTDNRLYYSLKEVANHFGVNVSLLRYWESEFAIINPKKTAGGTRQYTQEDIENIAVVFQLVKNKGMTLEGARQKLKTKYDDEYQKAQATHRLESIRNELLSILKEFDAFDEVDKVDKIDKNTHES